MTILNNSISNIFVLIIISVVLFILLSFLKSYLPILTRRTLFKRNRYKRWLYISELIIIVLGLLIFISISVKYNLVLSVFLMLILIAILFFISQFFLKDYLAGLFFKASKEYQIADQITVKNKTGKIEQFTKTQLKIKDERGNNIYIPYSKIILDSKTVRQNQEKVNAFTMNIDLKIQSNFETDSLSLKRYIRLLPWVHPAFEADITLIEQDELNYKLKLVIYAFDKKYYSKLEQAINDYL